MIKEISYIIMIVWMIIECFNRIYKEGKKGNYIGAISAIIILLSASKNW